MIRGEQRGRNTNMKYLHKITFSFICGLAILFLTPPLRAEQQGVLSCDMVRNYEDLISAHPGSLKCVLNKARATIGEVTLNRGSCEPSRMINIPKKAGELLFLEFTCDVTEAEIEVDGTKHRYSFLQQPKAQTSNDPIVRAIHAINNIKIGQ